MRNEVGKTMRKIESCRDMTGEGMKGLLRTGLDNMVKALERVLLSLSEELDSRRKDREEEEEIRDEKLKDIERKVKKNEDRLTGLEEKMAGVDRALDDGTEAVFKVAEAVNRGKKFCRLRSSEQDMERNVEDAEKKVKVTGIDFGKGMEDRTEMVRTVLSALKKDITKDEEQKFEDIMKMTKVVVLGKRTEEKEVKGKKIHTVPVLLCCPSIREKDVVERTLRAAGHRTSFYWPDGLVDFVRGARAEVRQNGYDESRYHVRIRPDRREGRVIIRADIRTKDGGRLRPQAYWRVPGEKKLVDELGINVYYTL
jgi:hypothetical protein